MPRKQNGYGSFGVSGFKGVDRQTNKGKGTRALGNYPSNRTFGSTVNRSVIEQYNIDSKWARWRRGLEYFYQGAYLLFEKLDAVLYQGSQFEIPVTFDGYRFATKNADSRTHYSIRRTLKEDRDLGTIVEVQNNQRLYPEQYASNEIWCKVQGSLDLSASDPLLVRSYNDRVTDGETTATISWVLTEQKRPASYAGKSAREATSVVVNIPLDEIRDTAFIKENKGNLQALVGQSVYMPNFEITRPVSLFDKFKDYNEYWSVDVADFVGGSNVQILKNDGNLPPLLGDIKELTPIYSTDDSSGRLDSEFIFEKARFQRFYGQQYLTADLVRQEVSSLSYAVQPWNINSIKVDEETNHLELTSTPFQASLYLYAPVSADRWVIFSGNSFTIQSIDNNAVGEYNHKAPIPGEQLWQKLRIDGEPWMDEVFTSGNPLRLADIYTCSCPAYLHAVIRNPEVYGETGMLNRQSRAPFPTAKGVDDYKLAGVGRAATIAQSWATADYTKSFKLCKHTIASMFINKIRVEEPNDFPAFEGRTDFEQKLAKDVNEVVDEFSAQLRRSEITTVEIVYALAEALNLDDIELGYVLLTSRF